MFLSNIVFQVHRSTNTPTRTSNTTNAREAY